MATSIKNASLKNVKIHVPLLPIEIPTDPIEIPPDPIEIPSDLP